MRADNRDGIALNEVLLTFFCRTSELKYREHIVLICVACSGLSVNELDKAKKKYLFIV